MAVRGRHLAALDGVRACAIFGVIAYHLGFGWASGGFLGVDLFFVLSGFLITSLLLEEKAATGRIALSSFWGRRAARLLPGLLLMLVVLGAFLALFGPGPLADLGQIRGDAVASVLYVANWHMLLSHQGYFARYAAPSPLAHTWSLGIEEQFYLLWPLVVLAVLSFGRRRWRLSGLWVAGLGAALSAGWMAYLALDGASVSRLYYGTDTRAFDLLCGALLAFVVAARGEVGSKSRLLSFVGPLAAGGLALFWWRAGGSSAAPGRPMFEWGFFLCALLGTLVLADVRRPEPSILGRLLATAPFVFLGQISYELYLWHWPVIVELDSARLHLTGLPLAGVQVVVSLGLASATYYLFDRPVRRAAIREWPAWLRAVSVPFGMALACLLVVAGTEPLASPVVAVSAPLAERGRLPGAGGIIGRPIALRMALSRANPLRVALIGDSVMRAEAPAVAAALGATGEVRVTDLGYDGWGFTTDHGWRTGVPALLDKVRPELVICMWSFDDTFLHAHPVLYRRWLDEFVHIVLSVRSVRGIVFEQFPVLGPLEFVPPAAEGHIEAVRNRDNREWNEMVSRLPARFPGKVIYLPLGGALTNARGGFSFFLPPGDRWRLPPRAWVRVRSRDGVHLCPPGAARYAAALLADLRSLYHLHAPAPGWATGRWTADRRYNEPAGNCPADHPS